jgi:hypothetical protein
MMKTRSSVFGLAALSLAFIMCPGLGLSFQHEITLRQITDEADLIVVGRVTDVEARWNDPALKTMIYTYTTLSVEEEIKGSSPEKEITIKVPGGVVDGIAGIMHGLAHFHTGERVVVFLLRDLHSSLFFVVEGAAGKYSIGIDNKVEFIGKSLSVFLDEIRQYISN